MYILVFQTQLKCACNPGYTEDYIGKRCLPTPTAPGDICSPPAVLCDPVSTTEYPLKCSPLPYPQHGGEHICECANPDHVTDVANKACLIKPQNPGDSCTPLLTPCTDVTDTACSNSVSGGEWTCRCTGDLVTNTDDGNVSALSFNTQELPIYLSSLSVSTSGECLIPPRSPGDPCHPKWTPCTSTSGQTECSPTSSTCECTKPSEVTHPTEGRCVSKPELPSDSCHPDWNPCSLVQGTSCSPRAGDEETGYYCKCEGDDFVTDWEENRCLKIPQLPDDECHPTIAPCDTVPLTECVNRKCSCDEGFIFDDTFRRCLVMPRKVLEPCHPTKASCKLIQHSECR
jgi:hypothetical protein